MQPPAPIPLSEPPEPLAPIPPLIPQQPMNQVVAMPQIPPLQEALEEEKKQNETTQQAATSENALPLQKEHDEIPKSEVDISKEEEMASVAEEVEEAKEG